MKHANNAMPNARAIIIYINLMFRINCKLFAVSFNSTYARSLPLFIEELAILKYKYIHKRKYSVVQNKQKREKTIGYN